MSNSISTTTNTSQLLEYVEEVLSKIDIEAKPKTPPGDTSISDGNFIDNPLSSFAKHVAVDYSGEISNISPSDALMSQFMRINTLEEGEVRILMDNDLRATVDKDGVKFEQMYITGGPNGREIAVSKSMTVAELNFSDLEKSSIGPGEGVAAWGVGKSDEGNVDLKTQKVTTALYDALRNVDKNDQNQFSDAQNANVNKVLEQLQPFMNIAARSNAVGEHFQLNSIQTDKHGDIELEYHGDNKTKYVTVKDEMITVEYLAHPSEIFSGDMLPMVERLPVTRELDLADMDNWTPEQMQEAGDLKATLIVRTNDLTSSEKKARDEMLVTLYDVAATPQMIKFDNGAISDGGDITMEAEEKFNPQGKIVSAE